MREVIGGAVKGIREPSHSIRDVKICMPTNAAFARRAFHAGGREAEDILLSTNDVDKVRLEPTRGFKLREHIQRQLLYHDVTRTVAFINPGLRPVKLTKTYDVLVFACPMWWDVLAINAVKEWKRQCGVSVCWINELWAGDVPTYKYWLPLLSEFDYVALGLSGSVKVLGDAIGSSCHYVPGGVDALRFNPYPNPPKRVIDIYSIGRRNEDIHQRILTDARTKRFFYLYDSSVNASDFEVRDHRSHRELYASVAMRSRFYMVAPAKAASRDQTHGQSEVAFRYFEGAAAGCVLVGQAPTSPSFRALFDWPDSVVEIRPDGSDALEVLTNLAADEERLQRASRQNVSNALLRHDWVYRWRDILRIAGIEPTRAMRHREERLGEHANAVTR